MPRGSAGLKALEVVWEHLEVRAIENKKEMQRAINVRDLEEPLGLLSSENWRSI